MKEVLIQEYNNTEALYKDFREPSNNFIVNFVKGAFLEVQGPQEKEYTVKFFNHDTGELLHSTDIKNNMWTRTNIKYFINWRVEVFDKEDNTLAFRHLYDAQDRRVYIHLDSSAIGDTLAWFPYVEEFRKKHKCKLLVSTFHNDWFQKKYPEIEFIKPGIQVFDLYAMYGIGWFYEEDSQVVDFSRTPIDFKQHPLQATSYRILGMEPIEIKPIIDVPNKKRKIKGKDIVIAPHASAHAKYWNYPGGWQKVIDYLNDKGYKVVMISSEPWGDEWHDSKLGGTLKGVVNRTGNISLKTRMNEIANAEAFIGLGSGLSWMSWALGTPTALISGFSYDWTEFEDCERISAPENICSGCFNREWLNPGDWEWCPDHKNTEKQFECTKTITPNRVITSLNKMLNIY